MKLLVLFTIVTLANADFFDQIVASHEKVVAANFEASVKEVTKGQKKDASTDHIAALETVMECLQTLNTKTGKFANPVIASRCKKLQAAQQAKFTYLKEAFATAAKQTDKQAQILELKSEEPKSKSFLEMRQRLRLKNKANAKNRNPVVAGKKWRGGIISYYWDDADKAQLEDDFIIAKAKWEDATCIRLVEVESTNTVQNHYRLRNPAGSKCASNIGYEAANNGWYSATCTYRQLTHEIGHSLGLGHTQARVTRDNDITVDTSNIKDDKVHNFAKKPSPAFSDSGPFDFESLMLYPRIIPGGSGWTKDGNDATVMSAKNVTLNAKWKWQREKITTQDAGQINTRYGCVKVWLQAKNDLLGFDRKVLHIHPDRKLKMVAMDAKRMFALTEGLDKIKLYKGSNELDQTKTPSAQGGDKNIAAGNTILFHIDVPLAFPARKAKWECCCQWPCDEDFFNNLGDCKVDKTGVCSYIEGEHGCAKALKAKIEAGTQFGCPAAGSGDAYYS